jgi:hypothetical protein
MEPARVNITVSAYNRPEYLASTLDALSQCDGIADCKVTVLLDPCDETQDQANVAARYGFVPYVYADRQGCNLAIGKAFAHGFADPAVEYHVHLEDDTVPTRDALRWFAWARDRYRENPAVMNVSGYQRISNGRPGECGLRRWFTPWGWATWRDRWAGLAAGWAGSEPSWDVIVNHVLRAGRYEAFPAVSRIQNIGAERGTHVPSAEWHTANHRVPVTADDLAGDPVLAWVQTREDDRADHS